MTTPRQYELLTFISSFGRQHGYNPSYTQMMEALGLKSKAGVARLMDTLEADGYVRRTHKRARSVEVLRLPHDPWRSIGESKPDKPCLIGVRGSKIMAMAIFHGGCWRHADSLEEVCFQPTDWRPLPAPPGQRSEDDQ